MSLGLNDLKKTRAAKASETSAPVKAPSQHGAGAVSENWARSSKTARPWTSSGLSKGPKARKPVSTEDAYMNETWADEHTGSIRAFDMELEIEVDSALTQLRDLKIKLKEQALEMERKLKRAALGPFEIMKHLMLMVQK